MSYAGVLMTVQLYQMEQADLTSQISDISMEITKASGQTADISQEEVARERAVREEYGSSSASSTTSGSSNTDSAEYQVAITEVQDEYNAKLANINEWEKQLDVKKQTLQTQLTEVSSWLESYKGVLKTNVKRDSSYGSVTSGSS